MCDLCSMMIGYGFNYQRISETILRLAKSGRLQMFIVDRRGVNIAANVHGDHDGACVYAGGGASGLSGPLGIRMG